jgi:hypothetical protein
MKWAFTMIFVFAALLGASRQAYAERSDPFAFGKLAILSFVNHDVKVQRTDDGRGVVLLLDSFSPALEALIRASLGGGGLNLRLLPKQQAEMAVEIYSTSLDIDFAVRREKDLQQILIGELRPERRMLELLTVDGGLELLPLPVIAELEAGQLMQARALVSSVNNNVASGGYLSEARIAALDACINGAALEKCPPAPPSIVTLGLQQGLLLAAWCEIGSERLEQAVAHLDALLADANVNPHVQETARRMKRRVSSGRVLAGERAGALINAANDYLLQEATIPLEGAAPFFYERLGQLLMQAGVGQRFAAASKVALATASDKDMLHIAPISAEALWDAGEEVRALDVAQFFERELVKAPSWAAGRLHRVLGMSAMRTGNWPKAVAALERSRALLGASSYADELALQEARLSVGTPAAELLPILQALHQAGAAKTSAWMDRWLSRLWGETWLLLGKLPSDPVLAVQPGYVLYRAAEAARVTGKHDEADHLHTLCAKARREDGWAELSAMVLETQATKARLEEIRKGMQVLK